MDYVLLKNEERILESKRNFKDQIRENPLIENLLIELIEEQLHIQREIGISDTILEIAKKVEIDIIQERKIHNDIICTTHLFS